MEVPGILIMMKEVVLLLRAKETIRDRAQAKAIIGMVTA